MFLPILVVCFLLVFLFVSSFLSLLLVCRFAFFFFYLFWFTFLTVPFRYVMFCSIMCVSACDVSFVLWFLRRVVCFPLCCVSVPCRVFVPYYCMCAPVLCALMPCMRFRAVPCVCLLRRLFPCHAVCVCVCVPVEESILVPHCCVFVSCFAMSCVVCLSLTPIVSTALLQRYWSLELDLPWIW